MENRLVHIVLCCIRIDGKILLLNRNNQPYKNYWAFPGGKVEREESVLTAALREAEEECGLVFSAAQVVGSAAEVIIDSTDNKELFKYDMSFVALTPENDCFLESSEGKLKWVEISDFRNSDDIVPTDIDMFDKFCIDNKKNFYSYLVEVDSFRKYCIKQIVKI